MERPCEVCQGKFVAFLLVFIIFCTILVVFNSFEEVIVRNPLLTVFAILADVEKTIGHPQNRFAYRSHFRLQLVSILVQVDPIGLWQVQITKILTN